MPTLDVTFMKDVTFYCSSTRHPHCGDFPNFATRCFPCLSKKTWSNWTPNDSFGFCSSRGFLNNLYVFNLIKFWLRFLGYRCLGILLMRRIQNCHLEPNLTKFSWKNMGNILSQNSGNHCNTDA